MACGGSSGSDAATTTGAPVTTFSPTTIVSAAIPAAAASIPEGAFDPNAGLSYVPGDLTVEIGTTITWTNQDIAEHTVTSGTTDGSVGSGDGLFDSGLFFAGESYSQTFDEAGVFSYFCSVHPWMSGTVTVTG